MRKMRASPADCPAPTPSASSTSTRRSRRASSYAAASPQIPAPTTIASQRLTLGAYSWPYFRPHGTDPSCLCGRGRRGPRCWAMVAQAPVRLPVRPALLGRAAAPADHARAPARGARAPGRRARPRGRARHGLLQPVRGGVDRAGRRARRLRPPTGDARPHDAAGRRARRGQHRGDARRRPQAALSGGHVRRRVPGRRARRGPRSGRGSARARAGVEAGRAALVGELFGDPHWVSPGSLRRRAEAAGLVFARRSGSPLGYFARFERPR